jgi:hypothetical protein
MVIDLSWRGLLNAVWTAVNDALPEEGLLSRDAVSGLVRFVHPIAPFNQPEFAAPLIGLGGVVLSLMLCGVAISSFATLIVALLALGLLLTRFYGLTFEVGAFTAD